MNAFRPGRGRLSLWLKLLAIALLFGATPAAAVRFYIPTTPGELDPAARVRIAAPRPVQLLFTFQTSGAPNMRATNFAKEQVANEVRASGLFSEISQTPVANGAVLSITINNIPEAGAARRGFATGLTFGLAGTTVTDNYDVTFDYLSGPDATPIHHMLRHAIKATIGRTDPPANATQVRNGTEAARIMIRQSLAHGLNAVGGNPAFVPGATSAVPATAPAQP
jgi:hypothetical protein